MNILIALLAVAVASPHAGAINEFFDDVLLVVNRLKDLIEPIVGLAVAAMIGLQYVTMRRQTQSQAERAEQSTTLQAQNEALAHIATQVETVKAAVAADPPKEGT